MKSTLTIKNFGPIKDAKLHLRNVNVLIGKQATGKSTIAKLYTICKSPLMYFDYTDKDIFAKFYPSFKEKSKKKTPNVKKYFESLEYFSLRDFHKYNTEIEFISPTHSLIIKGNKIVFTDNIPLDDLENALKSKDLKKGVSEIKKLERTLYNFKLLFAYQIYEIKIKDDNLKFDSKIFFEFFHNNHDNLSANWDFKDLEIGYDSIRYYKSRLFKNKVLYVPAERNIVSLIKRASLNLQKEKVPIPDHLLHYAAKYESATAKINKLDLSFLSENTLYRNVAGEDRIYYSERKSLPLSASASGIQSVIPLIIPILHERKNRAIIQHVSIVIEELETNLFPKAQYDVLKFIEKERYDDKLETIDTGHIHTYTTHSPFVLSSLNNMLFAYKKGHASEESLRKNISKIINEKNWINPEHFSAFEIKNGSAKSIFNRKIGLIDNNIIDAVSEEIVNDFRKIAQISIQSKEPNAKPI